MIDAHHHFWSYEPGEYAWITPDMEPLRRSFGGGDLRAAVPDEVTAVVTVQVRQSLAENDFMFAAARDCALVAGVVGWLPLAEECAARELERFLANPLAVGVREICQGEPDGRFLDNRAFDRGIAELTRRDVPYDLLIYHDQLPAALAFVDRHPQQRFVVDHLAKPPIRAATFPHAWERGLRELARRDHVWCKLSGMVTEVRDPDWSPATLRPYAEVALDAFTPGRVMFGSDWPVCLLRASYPEWHRAADRFLAQLSPDERHQIEATTAREFYSLGSP